MTNIIVCGFLTNKLITQGYESGTPSTPPAPVIVPASHPPHKQRRTMKPQPIMEESGLLTILLAVRKRKRNHA